MVQVNLGTPVALLQMIHNQLECKANHDVVCAALPGFAASYQAQQKKVMGKRQKTIVV